MMNTLEMVNDRVKELDPLYSRMDKTKDLVYLTAYELKGLVSEKKLDGVANVTTNWPAIFANAIISDLMGSIWQTVVEGGKLSNKQTTVIESFVEDYLDQIDEHLGLRGYCDLFTWLCNHVCIRSIVGARLITTINKDEYKVDCLPCDMRWTPFQFGTNGLEWVANITFRSAAQIEQEYGVKITGKDIKVIDFWDGEKNETYIVDKKVREDANTFLYPPFVIVIPSSGYMLRDKGYIEHEAEDLFFLNRELYAERSRSMTIEQTLAMDCLRPPYEQETEDPGKPSEKPPITEETLKVMKGELHKLLPRGDLTNAFRTGRADVQRDLQMGGVNDIDLGNVSQTVSAVWITEQSEIRNKLIRPRVKALNSFRQQLIRMGIDQYIKESERGKSSKELLVGNTGKKRTYSSGQLGDPKTYTITNELMSQSKKQELVNLAMFEASKDDLPLKIRLTDILKADDPDGIMRELEMEKAKRADPTIGLFEMALRYAEEAENLTGDEADVRKLQSMMLTDRLCALIRQGRNGQVPEEGKVAQPEPRGPGVQGLVPLLGKGGSGGKSQPEEEIGVD